MTTTTVDNKSDDNAQLGEIKELDDRSSVRVSPTSNSSIRPTRLCPRSTAYGPEWNPGPLIASRERVRSASSSMSPKSARRIETSEAARILWVSRIVHMLGGVMVMSCTTYDDLNPLSRWHTRGAPPRCTLHKPTITMPFPSLRAPHLRPWHSLAFLCTCCSVCARFEQNTFAVW